MFFIAFGVSYSTTIVERILRFWNGMKNMRTLLEINANLKKMQRKSKPKIAKCMPQYL